MLPFEVPDVEEFEFVELLVDAPVCVPAVLSWRARPATATTPTSATPASPAVTVVARDNPTSRCIGAPRYRRRVTPMLAAQPDGTV